MAYRLIRKLRPEYLMKKAYFISDFHFGINGMHTSVEREKNFLRWIREYQNDMLELYLVGDLFDFWYEYKYVVPKGGVRVLAALAKLKESGIPVFFFTGNHDQWMNDYFEKELDIPVYHDPILKNILGTNFMVGHGDGLGPGDLGYKFIKKIFRNKLSRIFFSALHPGIGIPLASYWSGLSRKKGVKENVFLGESKEWLIQYCQEYIRQHKDHPSYFIFGHRHVPIHWRLMDGSSYINLGDWLRYQSYVTFDGQRIETAFFENTNNFTFHSNIKQ